MASGTSTLTWNLIANADKYVMGMSKAAKATDASEKAQKRHAQSSKMLKVAVGAISTAAVVKFGKDSVAAYKAAEVSQAKLSAAFKKFPKLADTNIDALRDYNSQLQKKTKYDDDDTAAMQAHLAMYDLTGKQVMELTPLVQDLASATGQDLASAGDQLGKALLGNTRALKAIGINYKATGDKAKDFAAIQALVSAKVGGFAEQEGKTAAGQAAILANQYGDLQESVGEALVPALQALIDVARPVLEAFNGMSPAAKQTTIAVTALGGAFLLLAPRILAAKTLLMEFGGAKSGMAAGTARAGKFGGALSKVGGILGVAGPWGLAIGAGITALGFFASGSDGAAEAQQNFKSALDASNGALDKNVRKTAALAAENDGLLEAARALGIAESDVVDAILGDVAAKRRLIAATEAASRATEEERRQGAASVAALDERRDAAAKLTDGVGSLGDALSTEVSAQKRVANATETATEKVARLNAETNKLRASLSKPIRGTVIIRVREDGSVSVNGPNGGGRSAPEERAVGGPVNRGQTYLVGERGPELFTPSGSGRIIPNHLVGSRTTSTSTVASSFALGLADASRPVELRLDSERVWKGLLQLKKAKGGAKLHLD